MSKHVQDAGPAEFAQNAFIGFAEKNAHAAHDPAYLWMHAVMLLYLIFTALLFVLEPFVLRRRLEQRVAHDTINTRRSVLRMHRLILTLSLITIAGAVAGSHGWLLGRGERAECNHDPQWHHGDLNSLQLTFIERMLLMPRRTGENP